MRGIAVQRSTKSQRPTMPTSEDIRARLIDFLARPAKTVSTNKALRDWRRLSETISQDGTVLDKLAEHLAVTPENLVRSAWAVVIDRCTGANQATLGVADDQGGVRPLTVRITGTDSALTLCAQLAAALAMPAARAPAALARPDIDLLLLDAARPDPRGCATDWLVSGIARGSSVDLELWYHEDTIDADTAATLLQTAGLVLRALLAAPERILSALQLINPRPMQALNDVGSLERWNYDGPGEVTTVFAAQVADTPQACALKFSLPGQAVTQWTYRELDAAANRWAGALAARGVTAGSLVGMALARGPAAIALMLGALKLRAGYLPLDTGFPKERLAYMLANAGAQLVVCEADHAHLFDGQPCLLTNAATLDGVPAPVQHTPTLPAARPGDTAYVMYTSGSTGRPKGVAITHQAIVRLVCRARFMRLAPDVAMLHAAPLGFDASTLEIWGPLLNGGTCVIYTERLPTGHDLSVTIRRHGANAAWLTAALFNTLIDDDPAHLDGLSQILTGGEALSVAHIRRARRALPGATLINGYGPTESTTFTCTHTIVDTPQVDDQSIPIGRPVCATWLAVVNTRLEPVPAGVVGELLIGGLGLANGYLNSPEQTERRFIDNPFGEGPPRLYRTGDGVRLLPGGALDFVGRLDDQVKIRGYRVEPREIESVILGFESIRQCAVVVDKDPALGLRFLAWLAPQRFARQAIDIKALRTYLAEQLPDYMMPAGFAVIDELPVTVNGKLDRQALPRFADAMLAEAPTDRASRHKGTTATGELERLLCDVFARTLGLPGFAPYEHFFDNGGNSLLAIQALSALRSQHGITCPVGDFYSHPTPEGLARALSATSAPGAAGLPASVAEPSRATADPVRDEGIAIIGMAARYPGAPDLASFAANLAAGVDSIRRFTREELDQSIDPALRADPAYVPARGVLDGVEQFDADFFAIAPREAELLDPQQRIFLQLCWSCLEHGGYVPDATTGPVGVFAGMNTASYRQNNLSAHPDKIAQLGEFLVMLGTEKDYVATRTAHRLNLTGPAISVHTACSTSLVAIVQACESLAAGQCEMALAGGVSVTSPPASGHLYSEGAMLSPDGLTRSFDARAAGTVFSDGAGVVLLKRLADAIRDGDTIHAVIRGGAVNNDGGGKASFMAPSAAGQARVIRQALNRARVPAQSIDYIEAHGTATPSGDPIEIDALKQVFADVRVDRPSCAIGSVKSNIGHTVTAAGVAGVIRTVLALEQQRIPPTLHFQQLNPAINLDGTPFYIAAQPIEWPQRADRPRRAGVSSFGVGGTNAHVIIEEAPPRTDAAQPAVPAGPQVLRLSAHTEPALQRAITALADHLANQADDAPAMVDVAHTLNVARKPMRWRTTVVAHHAQEAVARLHNAPPIHELADVRARARPLVFVFPGQGAQYLQMGTGLMQASPVFAQAYTQAIDAFAGRLEGDLETTLLSGTDAGQLAQTALLQPALFCIEYALARTLIATGLEPAAMIGHSIGEYAAATIANVLSLEDAAALVARRGWLMQSQPPGRMLSVRLPANELLPLLPQGIDLAADNGPGSAVCAGTAEAIAAFAAELTRREIVCRELNTSHAFHSVMMEPAALGLRDSLKDVRLHAPSRRIVSTLTGDLLSDAQARDPDYWAQQLRDPVRFAPAVCAAIASLDDPIFLELGPRASLSTMIRQLRVTDRARPTAQPLLADSADLEAQAFLEALGALWRLGIDCTGALPTRGRRIALPTYSFDPQRHWLDAAPFGSLSAPMAQAARAAQPAVAGAAVATPAPLADANPVAPDSAGPSVRERLRELLEQASGLEFDAQSDPVPFAELGLDSLSLTQIAMQVKRAFKVDVSFRQLMQEHDSIDKLATWLHGKMPAAAAPAAAAPRAASPAKASSAPPTPAASSTASPGADADAPVPSARPFGAIARIQTTQTELSSTHRERIHELIERYVQRTPASKAYAQEHRGHMADPRVVTGFKPIVKEITYPLVIERSAGAYLWDLDGNQYVDVLNGFGMNLFGWQPAFVTRAVRQAIDTGYEIGPQHPLAGVVARGICELTGAERAALCNTGSEAVMGATRIARTVTGRTKVVMFDGAYHGIFDEVIVRGTRNNRALPAAPGIMPNTSENVISLPYGTPEALEVIRAMGDDIAAVLVEPVQSRRPDFQPREFLHELRRLTEEAGIVLVFDEVVTGFRSHPGGVQALFDIRADLVTYGKVIGGGFPIGVIAGKREFMDALDGGHWQFGDNSVPEVGVTYFAGTFVRHPLALAAASAVIEHLKAHGPELQARLTARTTEFAEEMNAFARSKGAPIEIRHFSSFWRIVFTAEHPMQEMLFPLMRMNGVHILDGFPCFFTTAHSLDDIRLVKDAFCAAVRELFRMELLPRPGVKPGVLFDAKRPPVPGARLGRDRSGKPAWYVPNPEAPGKFLRIDEHV